MGSIVKFRIGLQEYPGAFHIGKQQFIVEGPGTVSYTSNYTSNKDVYNEAVNMLLDYSTRKERRNLKFFRRGY